MRTSRKKGLWTATFALSLGVTAFACGGVSESPIGGSDGGGGGSSGGGSSGGSSSGTTSSSSSSGGSSSGSGVGCPASPPADYSSCKTPMTCEYGSDEDMACNAIAICDGNDWSYEEADLSGDCPTSPPGANGCPASYGQVSNGETCTGSADCAYPQGRCACTTSFGGPVLLEDAGVTSTWRCEQPQAGCPEPRPHAGATCSSAEEGLFCDYGSCTLPNGTAMECTGGVWTQPPSGCAVPLSN